METHSLDALSLDIVDPENLMVSMDESKPNSNVALLDKNLPKNPHRA